MKALQSALPLVEVRTAFSGHMTRKPENPVLCVGIHQEEYVDEACKVKLNLRLWTTQAEEAEKIVTTIFCVLTALPCSINSIVRSEAKYDAAVGCIVTPFTVSVLTDTKMQESVRMRFGNFVFPNDPKEMQVTHKAMIREAVTAEGKTQAECVGAYKSRVTGKGIFIGENALESYRILERLFGENHALFLPGCVPFEATLSELSRSGMQEKDRVEYTFTFIETGDKPAGLSGRTYLAKGGESLWDYAYFAGVSIDAMVQANPQLSCIASLHAGEVVHIP